MKREWMETKYWIEADDRQWQLKKGADVKNKEGVVSRRESIVGYFPKLGQAISALYERIVTDKIGTIDADSILDTGGKCDNETHFGNPADGARLGMSGRVYQGDNDNLRGEGKLAGRAEVDAAGTRGKKDDAGKQRWYAMPLCVLKDLADVFTAGKAKYGIFNCLQEFDNPKERFWDAMMRHLEECQIDPLSKDPEIGCYHAACVAFNALMYLYHCKRGAK